MTEHTALLATGILQRNALRFSTLKQRKVRGYIFLSSFDISATCGIFLFQSKLFKPQVSILLFGMGAPTKLQLQQYAKLSNFQIRSGKPKP